MPRWGKLRGKKAKGVMIILSTEKLARIGELSRRQRAEGLSEAESREQAALRQEYLKAFRQSFKAQLEAQGFEPLEKQCSCCRPADTDKYHQ